MKKALGKTILVTLVSGLMMISLSAMTAFAATPGTDSDIQSYVESGQASENQNFLTDLNGKDSQDYLSYSDNSGHTYYVHKNAEGNIKNTIKNKNNDKDVAAVEDKLSEVQADLGLTADTGSATQALSGLGSLLSTILGFFVILIGGYMTIQTALDCCYVAFPTFRGKCEDVKQRGAAGNGLAAAATKQGKDGETKIRFISDDAVYAVTAANTVETGKNPFSIYLFKRIWAFMIVAIVLYIFVSGNVFTFTKLAVKLASGFIKAINQLL